MTIIKSYIVTNAAASSGGGGGSGLTSFTVGNLSPLFTASLGADPLVNPALTFTPVNQNANLVYAGPATGAAAVPTFRALVAADIPTMNGITTSVGLGGTLTTNTALSTLGTEVLQFAFGNLSSTNTLTVGYQRDSYTLQLIDPSLAENSLLFDFSQMTIQSGLGSPISLMSDDSSGVGSIVFSAGATINLSTPFLGVNINANQGSAGEFLGSDGAGGVTWLTPAGGGGGLNWAPYTHNAQAGATYTLALTDYLSASNTPTIVEMTNGGANTVTVPPNSSVAFPIGASVVIAQYGAGLTTVAAGVGVTINSATGSLASPGQYATMVLEKRATNEWYLWYGDDSNVNLTQIAAISGSDDDIIQRKAGVWTNRTIAQYKADLSLNNVENTALSTWAGTANITTLGTIGTGTWGASVIGPTFGGTGQSTVTTGDLLYGSAANTWSKLGAGTSTHVLTSNGAGVAPSWQAAGGGGWAVTGTTALTGAAIIDGTTTNTISFRFNSLSVTAVEGAGLLLINETDAELGAQQISPSLTWKSEGWSTTSSATRTVAFKIDSLPIQGTTNPSGTWILKSSVNGAAYTAGHIVVNTSGAITIGDSALGLAVTIGGSSLINSVYTNAANNAVTIRSTYSIAAATGAIVFANNGSQTITSGTFTEVAFTGATFSASTGTGTYNNVLINSTVNQTGSASGTVTMLKISPTYTSVTGIAIGLDYSPVSGTPATNLAIRTTGGTVMFNATTKSANTGVGGLIIGNAGTNATGAQTDGVVIHSKDSSAGSANATLAFYLEQAVEAIGVTVATSKLRFWHNGTEYYFIVATV